MRPAARALALVSWLAVAGLACYAPDINSGTLTCGTGGTCPDGFTCLGTDRKCWKPSDVISGNVSCSTGIACPAGFTCQTSDKTCWKTGEMPSTMPMGGVAPKFEGHWVFTKAAMNATSCTDGSRNSRSLEDDWVDVDAGGAGDFIANYYCDWELNVAPNGSTATLRPGTTCMTTSTEPVMGRLKTRFTWTATSFTFVKTGASAATVNAELSANYTNVLTCTPTTPVTCVPCVTNCTGMCTVNISGPLTKTN